MRWEGDLAMGAHDRYLTTSCPAQIICSLCRHIQANTGYAGIAEEDTRESTDHHLSVVPKAASAA